MDLSTADLPIAVTPFKRARPLQTCLCAPTVRNTLNSYIPVNLGQQQKNMVK